MFSAVCVTEKKYERAHTAWNDKQCFWQKLEKLSWKVVFFTVASSIHLKTMIFFTVTKDKGKARLL